MGYYQDLDIWKLAVSITKQLYKIVKKFPKTETYALVDQLKRASTSIVSNIAEGSGRSSIPDNLRFLYMAQGSCIEMEAQIMLSKELGFLTEEDVQKILSEITVLQKMLFKFIQAKKNTLVEK